MMKGIFGFIVTMICLMFVCNACLSGGGSSSSSSSSTPSSSSYSSSVSSTPARIEYWRSNAYITDLEKEKRAYVQSNTVTSDQSMDFPYSRTTATINVVKNSRTTWAYIEFNNQPNIVNSETEEGYSIIRANVYIDGVRETATLTQEWGSKILHFRYPTWLIGKLKSCESFRINLRWYGNTGAVWSFSGKGFSTEYDLMLSQFNNL